MDSRLKEVAEAGKIEAFYELVGGDRQILEKLENMPFIDTPMHTAAAAGHTNFVMEMYNLKPSFAKKLNQDGYSPMHLALQEPNRDSPIDLALQRKKFELVLRLVYHDPDLIRVKGRNGMSLLHTVAELGNCDLLLRLLYACPDSVQDLTSRGETVLHVATNNRKPDAVELIVGWLLHPNYCKELEMEKLLNWRDNDGNAAIHLAISTGQVQVVKSLVNGGIYKDVVNSGDLTALQMLSGQQNTDDNKQMLIFIESGKARTLPFLDSRHINSKMGFLWGWMFSIIREINSIPRETCGIFLVVCVLLASTAYQTGVRPPSSVLQMKQYTRRSAFNAASPPQVLHFGEKLHHRPVDFYFFTTLNTFAFYISIMFILLLLPFPRRGFSLWAFSLSIFMIVSSYIVAFGNSLTSSSLSSNVPFYFIYLFVFWALPLPFVVLSFDIRRNIYFQQVMQYIVPLPLTRGDSRNQARWSEKEYEPPIAVVVPSDKTE